MSAQPVSPPANRRFFVPAPPFPAVYGTSAALALGLGLFGGFAVGLYALGVVALGWPAGRYASLVQAHGQVQTLGLAGLLILGVGALLLPGFWKARLTHPQTVSYGGGLAGLGLISQLVGQPLDPGIVRQGLLALAAVLPPVGFAWAASGLVRLRLGQRRRPESWELLLIVAGCALVAAMLVRAVYLFDLLWSEMPASYGAAHQAMIDLELHGFVLAATLAVQLRLLPSLARTRPVAGWIVPAGIAGLVVAVLVRVIGIATVVPELSLIGEWLEAAAAAAICVSTGLWRSGLAPTVQAPATLLPGRTRQVLRVAWAGLLLGLFGQATGILSSDAATHALTTVYLVPLILVVGIRMLPRVSSYPIRYPGWCGAVIWCGVVGGVLRAFGGLLATPGGWQLTWAGGSLVTFAVIIFTALAWSPWGVPTGVPRVPEVNRQN
jgi:hypothetical protein